MCHAASQTAVQGELLCSHGCHMLGLHPEYLANALNDGTSNPGQCASAIILLCMSECVTIRPLPLARVCRNHSPRTGDRCRRKFCPGEFSGIQPQVQGTTNNIPIFPLKNGPFQGYRVCIGMIRQFATWYNMVFTMASHKILHTVVIRARLGQGTT